MEPMVATRHKALHALFLDIDGVLNHEGIGRDPQLYAKINAVMQERFGDAEHVSRCGGCLKCQKAEASLFDAAAIKALTNLLHKISEQAEVHIVISSTWRLGKSVQELQEIFADHEFAKFIVDKTTDDGLALEELKTHCTLPHLEASSENFQTFLQERGLSMCQETVREFLDMYDTCRGSQIKKWLHMHPNYTSVTVLDDFDNHLTANFGQDYINTVHGSVKILTLADGERALDQFLQKHCH